jgi:hypothetical protein
MNKATPECQHTPPHVITMQKAGAILILQGANALSHYRSFWHQVSCPLVHRFTSFLTFSALLLLADSLETLASVIDAFRIQAQPAC